jgi:hypothetical protein
MPRTEVTKREREIKQLRKHLRQSKGAIPGVLVFGMLVFGVLFVIDLFVTVHWSVYALFLWVVPFGLIMDGVNIVYIKRRLAKLTLDGLDPVDDTKRQ